MATTKLKKKTGWGGRREGAGRPITGFAKKKKCISVNEAVWQSALRLWRGHASPLVEKLLLAYVGNANSNQNAEAI
jgi:hypothetical protein